MTLFSNRHVVAAMVVTPILAVLAYFAVDLIVAEQPQPALVGQSYPLQAKSNCRYSSGQCDLHNGDFQVTLTVVGSDKVQQPKLHLSASHGLQDVKVGFRDIGSNLETDSSLPNSMLPAGNNRLWSHIMPIPASANTQLMMVIFSEGVRYYAQTTMGFSEYKTSFNKNFKAEQ